MEKYIYRIKVELRTWRVVITLKFNNVLVSLQRSYDINIIKHKRKKREKKGDTKFQMDGKRFAPRSRGKILLMDFFFQRKFYKTISVNIKLILNGTKGFPKYTLGKILRV